MAEKCTKCGICTKVCPITDIRKDNEIYLIFENDDFELWNCCSCFLCEENCPINLSVREEMFKRRRSINIDNFPQRIRKYLKNIEETGFVFPLDEVHNLTRKKIGLKELNLEKIRADIKKLFLKTEVGDK
ncbi:MAG: 4Fe-4S dicluster domain-containing protein [Candidatus Helarchaeota archaeon]